MDLLCLAWVKNPWRSASIPPYACELSSATTFLLDFLYVWSKYGQLVYVLTRYYCQFMCQSDNTVMAHECWQVALFLSEDLNVLSTYSMTARVRNSSVVISTRYGLDCPGIGSRFRRDFAHPSRPAPGPTQPPIQWLPALFPGVKRSGRGVDHLPPSSAEVKERVELYLYSSSGPSWPVLG